MGMDREVVCVKAVGPRQLRVSFDDGVSGVGEFRESFFHGVFERIKDSEVFAQVHCEHGFVEWPGDLDLAPDAMYEEIRRQGRWVLV